MHSFQDYAPVYERISDYLFNMTALTRREARQQWRNSIKEAWNNRCAYCGKPPIDDESITIDHVRPKSKGGEDRTSNCIPACTECNQNKSSQDWVAWNLDDIRMRPLGRSNNRHLANLIYNGGDCLDVWVNGQALRKNGETLTLDESKIINELDEAVYSYYEDVE